MFASKEFFINHLSCLAKFNESKTPKLVSESSGAFWVVKERIPKLVSSEKLRGKDVQKEGELVLQLEEESGAVTYPASTTENLLGLQKGSDS